MRKDVLKKYKIDANSEIKIRFEQEKRQIDEYLNDVVKKYGYQGLKKLKNGLAEGVDIEDEVEELDESTWSRYAATDEQEEMIKNIEKWLGKLGKSVRGGTTIGRSPQTVVLDLTYQGGEIYVRPNGAVTVGSTDLGGGNGDDDYDYDVEISYNDFKAAMKPYLKESNISEASFDLGDMIEVNTDVVEVETGKGKDAELYRGEMFKIITAKNKYYELKAVKPNGELWSDDEKVEFVVTSDKISYFRKV